MRVRRRIRWVVRHGLPRWAMQCWACAGDLDARLLADPTVHKDSFPCYAQLCAKGRIIRGELSLASAHPDSCQAVLRSPDFDQPCFDRPSKALQRAMEIGGREVLALMELPSMLATGPPDHIPYRKLASRAFSARAIAVLRSRVEDIVEELLDEIARVDPDEASVYDAPRLRHTPNAPLGRRAIRSASYG
jgi:cytochrome P450